MMKDLVLITGATGFLGSYLIDECLKRNYQVLAMGRNVAKGQALERENVTFIEGDITKVVDLEKVFAYPITKIIHAAALSTVWGEWDAFYRSNVLGTKNILHYAQKKQVSRLVYVSSPSIYASAKDQLRVTEDAAPKQNELNNYIKSKLMSEQLFKDYPNLPYVIIRPRGIFGVGDSSIIPRLLEINKTIGIPLLNGGQNQIDLTCAENVAYAIGLMLENPLAIHQVYNITNDQPMVFKDLVSYFFKQLGQPVHFRKIPAQPVYGAAAFLEWLYKGLKLKGEPRMTLYTYYLVRYSQTLSVEKAKGELGYAPIMTLEEGIDNYVKNQKS
ncbi:NAD-dependent epimerase/dehydratase family protein [Streptococcus porcinus]|uniref:NAD-dependent epimerase/dehydratase family protein n=1 Tax=Streptococcus porcinus str. Jelinkova 176 TaxID=873448 RepID=A0ABN0CYX1_STRPO|nr:NAD-dependent epimerase/dehydratase family protein [Streptococcus porcinus str. Jelinkova 176]